MFKEIPGNTEYKISLEGKVISSDGSACTPDITNNKLRLTMFGETKLLDISWLGLIAHYRVNLPISLRCKLWTIRFTTASKRVAGSVNNKVMVFKVPLMVRDEYRIIPGFTEYAINRNGVIIKTATGENVKIRVPTAKENGKMDDYPSVDIVFPTTGFNKSIGVHRLMGLAWVGNNDYINRCIINHKDGNKLNPFYLNIEWVTYTENTDHAFATGLRTDNIPCKVRSIKTKEVTEFPTIRKACRFMGIGEETKTHMLFPKRKSKLFNGEFEFKYVDDNSPWFYENIDKPLKTGRYVLTVTLEDDTVETYYDIRDAVIAYRPLPNGVPKNALLVAEHIRKKPRVVDVALKDNYETLPIQAYEITTGKILEAATSNDLGRLLDMNYSNIARAIKAGETRVCNGFAFRYKSQAPWNTSFTLFESSPRCILATNPVTKEELKFDSLRKAAEHFTVDRSVIKKRLNLDYHFNNWVFKEILY